MGSCTSKPQVDVAVRQYLGEAIAPASTGAQPAQLLQVSTQLQDLAFLTSSLQATVAQLQQQQESLKDQISKASVGIRTRSPSSVQEEDMLLPGGTLAMCPTPRRLPPLSLNGASDAGAVASPAYLPQAVALLQPTAGLQAHLDRPSHSPCADYTADGSQVSLVAQLKAQLESLSQRLISVEGNVSGFSSMRESWEAQRAADEFAKQLKKVQEMGIPMHSLGRGRESQRGSGHGSGSASVAMSWDEMPSLEGLPQGRYPSNPRLYGRGGRGAGRGRGKRDDPARSHGCGSAPRQAGHGGSSGGGAGAGGPSRGGGGHAWGEGGAGQRHPLQNMHGPSKQHQHGAHHLRTHSSVQPTMQRSHMELPADSCRIMSSPTLSPPNALGTARSLAAVVEQPATATTMQPGDNITAPSLTIQCSDGPGPLPMLPRFSRPGTENGQEVTGSKYEPLTMAAGTPAAPSSAGPTSAGSLRLRHTLSHGSSGSGCGAESVPISPKNMSMMGSAGGPFAKDLGATGKTSGMMSGDLPSVSIQAHWGGPASGPL